MKRNIKQTIEEKRATFGHGEARYRGEKDFP